MPRTARIKANNFIYHIMLRSISDVDLFRDREDKIKFLFYIKRYLIEYNFKLYAYCLMSNHVHLIIDSNGADISKIMQGVNQCYAQYYNRKYNRYGHLFQGRYKSKVVHNEKYLMALSIYIHNNPRDMSKYRDTPEKYEFSSLALYLGRIKDSLEIVNFEFILSFFGRYKKEARRRYIGYIYRYENKNDIEIIGKDLSRNEEDNLLVFNRDIIRRDNKMEDIIEKLARLLRIDVSLLSNINTISTEHKAIVILLLRNLCSFTYNDINKLINDFSHSYLSKLKNYGIELLKKESYKNIYNIMIETCS